ncbi:MAG: ABC transporter permease [Desulfobacter sp.]|nr:MAG: ABC transporter permease [Desulfobacter sp.]
MTRFNQFQQIGLFVFLVAMGLFFSFMSPYFATWENATNILVQSTVLIIAGTGMTLVIATAGIDLSIGSILALSGIIMAAAMKAGLGVPMGIFFGVLSGALMGLLNGMGIARLGISPFIVTLGTAGIYRAPDGWARCPYLLSSPLLFWGLPM